MQLELTEIEVKLIQDRRRQALANACYNEALRDAYNVVSGSLPHSETRIEVLETIKSLQREEIKV